jgi:uncharacterized membrane protein HdeD (DUF308 family)
MGAEARRELIRPGRGPAGAASVIFSLILFLVPGAGALSLVWLIGVYAIGFGILLLFLAFRLRRLHTTHATPGPTGASP